MNRRNQRLAAVSFATGIAVTLFLCGLLTWFLSVSQFMTHPEYPPLALPVGLRYRQFLSAVIPGFLVGTLAVGVVCKMEWKRNRFLCGTLWILLLHRLLELHIVFVIVNSGLNLNPAIHHKEHMEHKEREGIGEKMLQPKW